MKFNATFALIVICGLVACSQALPAKKRLAYYQQPAAAQYYAAPQRMMFMRYVQPSFGAARSHQAAAALVAGVDCVHTGADGVVAATGPVEAAGFSGEVQDDAIAAAGAHISHSVAEAYPAAAASAEEQHKVSVQVDLDPVASAEVSDDEAKEGREYNYDAPAVGVEVNLAGEAEVESPEPAAADAGTATVSVGFSGAAESEAPAAGSAVASKGIDVNVNLPAPAPIAPVAKPARRYLPANKKKVVVELEHAADAEDDADSAVAVQDDEDVEDEPLPPRRSVARKPARAKPLPAGTFFPVDFGGATGGAIAIANSFSTGEGGAATSHAIAYGNPDQARAHVPSRRRH
uniref:Probable rRNA maturation factor n=1 Tax=Zeugodacus cucurbitae TaxID=28588 RepID=A0A0A1XDS8_ZEUCU